MNKEDFIKIEDESPSFSKNLFSISSNYQEDIDGVLLPEGLLKDRIEKLAIDITQDLKESESIATLCVLKGGFKFFSVLMNKIDHIYRTMPDSKPLSINYIKVKNMASSDDVHVTGLDSLDILQGKDVLIAEGIVDTGRSMKRLLHHIQRFKPKSVRVVSLFVKRTPLNDFRPDYIGFEIPDVFIVGFGLDYNDQFRDLHHVCLINSNGIEKYAHKKAN